MSIYSILESKPHNPHFLLRYFKFIFACAEKNKALNNNVYVERHHICPKSKDLFPEYASFSKYPWNEIKLTADQHFVAHRLLWKSFPSSSMGYVFLCFCQSISTSKHQRTIRRITNKTYKDLKIEDSKRKSERLKGKVQVKNTLTGKNYLITCEEYKNKPDYIISKSKGIKTGKNEQRNKGISLALKGKVKSESHCQHISESHKGIVIAFDNVTMTKVSISKEEFDNNQNRYSGNTVGYANYRNLNGDIIHCQTNDSRVISGELVHMSKNYICVKDINANRYHVHKDDPRIISGEFIKIKQNRKNIAINDGIKNFYTNSIELEKYILSGCFIGHLPNEKMKLKKWMKHPNLKSVHIYPEDFEQFLSKGYSFGRTFQKNK